MEICSMKPQNYKWTSSISHQKFVYCAFYEKREVGLDIRDWGKEDFCSRNEHDFQRMVGVVGSVNKPDSSSSCLTSAHSLVTLYKRKQYNSMCL